MKVEGKFEQVKNAYGLMLSATASRRQSSKKRDFIESYCAIPSVPSLFPMASILFPVLLLLVYNFFKSVF